MTELNISQSSPPPNSESLDLLPLNICIPNSEVPALTKTYFNAYKAPIDSSNGQVSDNTRLSSVFRGRTLIGYTPLAGVTCVVADIAKPKGEDNSQIKLIQYCDSLVEWTFPEDSESSGILFKSTEWFEIADSLHSNS